MPPPQHSQIQAINLRSLQRSDPAITAILAQAAYVVAYRAAEPTGEPRWDKMGVEGSLFVYQSTAPPHKGVLILNRNGIHNYQKPLIPQHTTVHVEGSWVYIHGIDMDSLTPPPPPAADSPNRRSNRRARAKPQPPAPTTTDAAQTAQDSPSVTPSSYDDARRTRVALYCHHSKESGGEEEARKLGQVLRSICMDPSASPPPQPAQAAAPNTPSPHPGIAHTTSAPVMPTATGAPLLPSQQEPSGSGMSMTDLLSKLSQTASTPANNAPQPFPPAPASAAVGPGGYPPPMNGGGNQHYLHPGNGLGVPETLQHANSWSVGQVPPPHPMAGTSSPQRMPAPHPVAGIPSPHPMAGISSPRPMASMSSPQPPNNVPPHAGTANHAVDLTASLKQMLGLGTSSSPTHHRAPTNTVNGPPMTPASQYVNAPMQPHLMTPTRRFDDPRSLHHHGGGGSRGATPPPIHLAPALDMNGRSHSPLQASSVHRPMSQPPSRQLSQHQVQTNSPRNTTTTPVSAGHSGPNDTQPRPRPNQGYIPNPNRNNDPFTIGSTSAGAATGTNSTTQTLDTDRLTHAVVDTWNNHQPGIVQDHHTPDENDKEQKRDFVRALLSAIHTDKTFVDQLWKEYCDAQRGR